MGKRLKKKSHEKHASIQALTVMMMANTTAPNDRMVWKINSCPMVEHTPKATKCRWISGWSDTKVKKGMSSSWCTSVTNEKIVLNAVMMNIIWMGLRSCGRASGGEGGSASYLVRSATHVRKTHYKYPFRSFLGSFFFFLAS